MNKVKPGYHYKLLAISSIIFLVALTYYCFLSISFPVLFNVDNYENHEATRYLAKHHEIPVVRVDNDNIYFTQLGTTRLLRPPLTYIVSAFVFEVSEPFIIDETARLRLGAPILAALTLVVAFFGFYFAFTHLGMAALGTLVIATMPRYVFLATCNNDDIGAIFTLSLLFSAVLALRRFGLTAWVLVSLACAFGLVILSKYTAWLALPWFLLYLAISLRNDYRRVVRWSPLLVILFIVAGGWWLGFNMVHYGVTDPTALSHSAQLQQHFTGESPNLRGYQAAGVGLMELLSNHDQFLIKSYKSLVGYLQWIDLEVGWGAYLLYGLVFGLGIAAALIASLGKTRHKAYFDYFLVLLILSQCLFYLHHNWLRDVQPQARYVLPVIMASVFLFLRLIERVPDSVVSLRFMRREYGARCLLICCISLLFILTHVNVLANYVYPAYLTQPFYSKLGPQIEYPLEHIPHAEPGVALSSTLIDGVLQISRTGSGVGNILLGDEFCQLMPSNAIISIEVDAPSAGGVVLRFAPEQYAQSDDVYWRSVTTGKSSINFSVRAGGCYEAKLGLGTTTHLLNIRSIKVSQLMVHYHGQVL